MALYGNGMDSSLYRAAQKGDLHLLKDGMGDPLNTQLTPNKNTVLHVLAQFGDYSTCVKEILTKQPSLLSSLNMECETSLHIAARKGRIKIVQALLDHTKGSGEDIEAGAGVVKEILRMTNNNGDTALHEAVRNRHFGIVKLLIEEDPDYSYPPNNAEESPLYLAVERGYHEVIRLLAYICKSPSYGGPGGRTALHAAAVWNCEECMDVIVDKRLVPPEKLTDAFGWTPLHYAARYNYRGRLRQLLNADKSLAYFSAQADENKTALHVAAICGHWDILEELLLQCPDCWEMVTSQGQNILHLAVQYEQRKAIKFILANSWANDLINQKDVDGNTPLHLFVTSDCFIGLDLVRYPGVDTKAFNNKNLTPLDVIIHTDMSVRSEVEIKKELRKIGASKGYRNTVCSDNDAITAWKKARSAKKRIVSRDMRKVADTRLIVAALVATITFTAGFTIPGGLVNSDGPSQGMAVMTRKVAFKIFVVTDSVAMVCSTAAVCIELVASFYEKRNKLVHRHISATILVVVAMASMVIAFVTGLYTVLAHSPGLAITVCIIGCSCFVVFYFLFRQKLIDFRYSVSFAFSTVFYYLTRNCC